MKAALTTEGNTITQRALSSRSCGMLSGMSRISLRTVAAFWMRSASFSSLSFADEIAGQDNKRISASAPAVSTVNRLFFIRTASFNDNDQDTAVTSRNAAIRRQNDYPSDQRQSSDNGWYRNRVVLFFGGLDGADVQDLLVGGVGNALIGERQNSNDDQHDAEESHIYSLRYDLRSRCPINVTRKRIKNR